MISFYLDWLKPPAFLDGYDIAAEAIGATRPVPYYDHKKWADHVSKHGLPVSLQNRTRVPEFPHLGAWETDAEGLVSKSCAIIGSALGLPVELFGSLVGHVLVDEADRQQRERQQPGL